MDPGLFRGLQLQLTVTLLLGGVSKQLSYGIVDGNILDGNILEGHGNSRGGGGLKQKCPQWGGEGGRVWIFSGTTHDDVLLLELAANYFKL